MPSLAIDYDSDFKAADGGTTTTFAGYASSDFVAVGPNARVADLDEYDSETMMYHNVTDNHVVFYTEFSYSGGFFMDFSDNTNEVRLFGGSFGDILRGGSGEDSLIGQGGDDVLEGGAGADLLDGGAGYNVLSYEHAASRVGVSLADYEQNATLVAASDAVGDKYANFQDIRGSRFNDVLVGDGGQNWLEGGAGADSLDGGGEFDFASYRHATFGVGVSLKDSSVNGLLVSGSDADGDTYVDIEGVRGSSFADVMFGSDSDNYLFGLDGADQLSGNDGTDGMFGGAGADLMFGDAGDDFFGVEDVSEVVAGEAIVGGSGTDKIITYITTHDYVLDLGVAALLSIEAIWYGDPTTDISSTISVNADQFGDGLAFDAEIFGNIFPEVANTFSVTMGDTKSLDLSKLVMKNFDQVLDQVIVTGDADGESITGTSVADLLSGGGGNDTLSGGGGNDIFVVDNAGDTVNEAVGGGSDRIAARADYSIGRGQEIELLTTTNANAVRSIDLTGNELAQTIVGNNGQNVLHDGGVGGADTLAGRGGNDIYVVYNSAAIVVEGRGQGDFDRVAAGVDYTLKQGAEVESLRTTSQHATYSIYLTGNEFGQQIIGNDGGNRIDGKGGNDTILTGLGRDTVVFSTVLGSGNVDTIKDFDVTEDLIFLDSGIFRALPIGLLHASLFKDNGTGVRDPDDKIIYNSNTGSLFYDADGLGGAVAVKFASLAAGQNLTAADFVVI